MKKTLLFISLLSLQCIASLPLVAESTSSPVIAMPESQVNEDLKAILEKSYLTQQMEPFLNMVAAEAIQASGKEMDAEDLIGKFRDAFHSGEALTKLAAPFLSAFSLEELSKLRAIYEEPVWGKYMRQAGSIFQSNLAAIRETFKDLAVKNGTEIKAQEPVSTNIIEVTKENFEEVVLKAQKPLIIDVYSTSCGPCRMMDPILKELSNQHQNSVQFVKINCDTQPELATRYAITQLPTLLFVRPGEEAIALKTTGFTSKKDLNEKIVQFVK